MSAALFMWLSKPTATGSAKRLHRSLFHDPHRFRKTGLRGLEQPRVRVCTLQTPHAALQDKLKIGVEVALILTSFILERAHG